MRRKFAEESENEKREQTAVSIGTGQLTELLNNDEAGS